MIIGKVSKSKTQDDTYQQKKKPDEAVTKRLGSWAAIPTENECLGPAHRKAIDAVRGLHRSFFEFPRTAHLEKEMRFL